MCIFYPFSTEKLLSNCREGALSTFDPTFDCLIILKIIRQGTTKQLESFGKCDFTVANYYWIQIGLLVFDTWGGKYIATVLDWIPFFPTWHVSPKRLNTVNINCIPVIIFSLESNSLVLSSAYRDLSK